MELSSRTSWRKSHRTYGLFCRHGRKHQEHANLGWTMTLWREDGHPIRYGGRNGFEAGPLKVRLHNLPCTRTCQINLKSRKVRLEKEIFEIEATNCGLEQRLKVLDMCVMGMEEKKYQEMKASLGMQKIENCSSISKLQVDLCQVEESLKGQSTAQIR